MPVETITDSANLARGDREAGYPPRKRWTRTECEALESTGLWEGERLVHKHRQ